MESHTTISVVEFDDVPRRLGSTTGAVAAAPSRVTRYAEWQPEIDDEALVRYLYGLLRPRRHLQLGVGGRRTRWCLEETEATVWSVLTADLGLRDGAEAMDAWARERGENAPLAHRLCHVDCRDHAWDTSVYPAGFFDSALIVGDERPAHQIAADSRSALSLVRDGGCIMWHGFCPDPEALAEIPALTAVTDALTQEWPAWSAALQDAFWVRPSLLLVGIR